MRAALRITPDAIATMLAHAREEAPNECCGLLLGVPGHVYQVHRAQNLDRSPTRYTLDPRDHFAAIRHARQAGLQVIGAYHSHPASVASPSPTDLAEANYRDFAYVIVSLAGEQPAVAAYRFRTEGPLALDLEIEEKARSVGPSTPPGS